jgi:hypothetical protein
MGFVTAESAEYFIETVTSKHQPDDQPHDAIERIRKTIKRAHRREIEPGRLFLSSQSNFANMQRTNLTGTQTRV